MTSLLSLALFAAGCGSGSASAESPTAGASSDGSARDDAGALADLQESNKWTGPRCRWLETGAWVLASPQEEALYQAASQMGFIEMTETGKAWHLNRNATAWKVALTDRGRTEAATCSATSKRSSWGVPVSKRRFLSGTFVEQQSGGRMVYAVEFAWVPTPVGDQVLHVLTRNMAVEDGTYRAKVYLKKDRAQIAPGRHGWVVDAIDDRGAERLR